MEGQGGDNTTCTLNFWIKNFGPKPIHGSARQQARGREETVGREMKSGEMVEEVMGWVGRL